MLVVLGASAASAWLAAREPASDGSAWARVPRFAIVLVLVLSAGGTLVGYLASALARQPDGSIDPGVLATIRTGVLAVAALVVAGPAGTRGSASGTGSSTRCWSASASRWRARLHALAAGHPVCRARALRRGPHHGASDAPPSGLTERRGRGARPVRVVQHRPPDADDVGAPGADDEIGHPRIGDAAGDEDRYVPRPLSALRVAHEVARPRPGSSEPASPPETSMSATPPATSCEAVQQAGESVSPPGRSSCIPRRTNTGKSLPARCRAAASTVK